MKERSRLMLSITLTVLVHVGFVFYVGQSSATVPSNNASKSASKVMNFNLVSFTEQKVVPQKTSLSKPVKLASKATIVKTKMPIKKVVEKIVKKERTKKIAEKEIQVSKEIIKPKEQVAERKNNDEANIPPLQVETTTPLTASNYEHENTVKTTSVARQVDNIIVQQARFKSLPPAPNYPRRARLRGQQGTALVRAQLNITGEVINTRLVKSSGFTLLDNAAIKAVYHWDFMPGTTMLNNVQVWVEIPVEFSLKPVKVG